MIQSAGFLGRLLGPLLKTGCATWLEVEAYQHRSATPVVSHWNL